MSDDSDSDLDEIAYVGNDDDERGPGCLVAMTISLSLTALIALLIAGVFAALNGLFDRGLAAGPALFFGFVFLGMAGIFGLFIGGAGIGMSLKSLQQCRQLGRADLIPFTWLGLGLAVSTLIASLGLASAVAYGWTR